MRYRRISYRYAFIVGTGTPEPLGGFAQARQQVRLAPTWWRPAADIFETAAGLRAVIELPGVALEEVDVVFYEDAVVIEGQRSLPPPPPDACYRTAEIRQGAFRREIPLPWPIDPERTTASYQDGLLTLDFPRPREGGDR